MLSKDLISKNNSETLIKIIYFIVGMLLISQQEAFFFKLRGQKLLNFLIVLFGLILILRKDVIRIILQYGKSFVFTLIYFLVIWFIDFGDSKDLFMLFEVYFIGFIFFIIGIYTGLTKKEFVFFKMLKYVFIVTVLNILPFTIFTILSGGFDKLALSKFYGMEENPLIMFWPFIFIIINLSFFFNVVFLKKRSHKFWFYFLYVFGLLSLLVSAYAAIFFMQLMFILILRLFSSMRNGKITYFKYVVLIVISYSTLNLVSSGFLGELGGTATKVNALFSAFSEENHVNLESNLDEATSSRYTLWETSFDKFFESPILGNGYYFASVGENVNLKVASGHSSVFDFLSYFGVFAILPFYIFVSTIRFNWNLLFVRDYINKLIVALTFTLTFSLFVMSFVNPYLQFSILNLVFLMIGLSYGKYYNWKLKNKF